MKDEKITYESYSDYIDEKEAEVVNDFCAKISNQKVNKDSIKQLFDEILEKVNLIELKSIISGSLITIFFFFICIVQQNLF